MKFGKELRKRREAFGFKLRRDFSDATDLSYSCINALERDSRPIETIEIQTVIKISEVLGWEIKDIAKSIRPHIKWRNNEKRR